MNQASPSPEQITAAVRALFVADTLAAKHQVLVYTSHQKGLSLCLS
jgi:hypothetical protein